MFWRLTVWDLIQYHDLCGCCLTIICQQKSMVCVNIKQGTCVVVSKIKQWAMLLWGKGLLCILYYMISTAVLLYKFIIFFARVKINRYVTFYYQWLVEIWVWICEWYYFFFSSDFHLNSMVYRWILSIILQKFYKHNNRC